MSDILSNQSFQFAIASIIAIIGLFLAIYFFWKNISRKKLTYEIKTFEPLTKMDKDVENKIEILYEGNTVKRLFLSNIRIVNSGLEEITKENFETPISIDFGKGVQILSCDVMKKVPNNLELTIIIANNRLIINPLLLNRDDRFVIKLLISNPEENRDINISARIAGVKKIEEKPYFNFYQSVNNKLPLIAFILFFIFWILPLAIINPSQGSPVGILVLLFSLITTAIIILMLSPFLQKRSREEGD